MTLREALEILHAPSLTEAFPEELHATGFTFGTDDLDLSPERVRANASFCSLEAGTISRIEDAAEFLRANPAAALVVRLLFRRIFCSREACLPVSVWRDFDVAAGDLAGPLRLLIASGFIPLLRAFHKNRHVPEEITRATAQQVRLFGENHVAGTGRLGMYPQQLAWMCHYLDPGLRYLRLGRFEYMTRKYDSGGSVFRHKETGELVIFAAPGLAFGSDGFPVGSNPDSPERAFISFCSDGPEESTFSGNPVGRDGRTSPEVKTIRLKEYRLVLGKGMPVLDMHIPSGGGMTPDESERSFRTAAEYYGNLPDVSCRPAAIVSESWIFNPNLPEFLPPESNLVRLLRRVHPVPCAASAAAGLWFIFRHEGEFDLAKAPRNTRLQRAVAGYLENGGRWRTGRMFLLMDEIVSGSSWA